MTITISGNNGQYDYSIYDGQDVEVAGPANLFQNCVFANGFTAAEACTAKNSVFLGSVAVAAGKTLTLLNCLSPGAKPAVDGTIADTDCLWSTDPLMVDPDNGDFRLGAESPAKSAGVDVGLTEDYIGTPVPDGPPDIGAYQTPAHYVLVAQDSDLAAESENAAVDYLYRRITMPITALPAAPTPADTRTDFNTKAFALVAALGQFVTDANATSEEVDADADAAEYAKLAAEASAANAASVYASVLALSGAAPYAGGTTYYPGDAVIGSNGLTYVRINTSAAGDDPVTSGIGNWQQVNMRPWSYVNHTSSPTLSLTDLDGSLIHTNTGAAGEVVFALPAGAANLLFRGYIGSAQNFKLTAEGSQIFRYLGVTSAGGGYVQASAIGNYIEAKWTGVWVVSIYGKWSVDGSTSIGQNELAPELRGELNCQNNTIGFALQTATGDGSTSIDWRRGNKFNFTFGAQNEIFTFIPPTYATSLTLRMQQDPVGGRGATFPTGILWANKVLPLLQTAPDAVDIITFYWDMTSFHGGLSPNFGVPA